MNAADSGSASARHALRFDDDIHRRSLSSRSSRVSLTFPDLTLRP